MVHIRDQARRLAISRELAKPLLLDANPLEIQSCIAVWNVLAPARNYMIDPKKPLTEGQARRVNALIHAFRDARGRAALYAGQKCLEIVKESGNTTQAAERISKALTGKVEEHANDELPAEHRPENQ